MVRTAIRCFYVPAGFICYILACLRCLWATAELQDSWLRGPSFQMGNFCFLPVLRKMTTSATIYINIILNSPTNSTSTEQCLATAVLYVPKYLGTVL